MRELLGIASERALTLLEASRLREAKVTSQMKEATLNFEKEVDQLRKVIAEKDELLERRSAAHDESLTKIQQLIEKCKRATDKVWHAKGERDIALEQSSPSGNTSSAPILQKWTWRVRKKPWMTLCDANVQ